MGVFPTDLFFMGFLHCRGLDSSPATESVGESWEDELMSVDGMDAQYYKLNLDISRIQMVDSKEKYHECISCLSKVGDGHHRFSLSSQEIFINLIMIFFTAWFNNWG